MRRSLSFLLLCGLGALAMANAQTMTTTAATSTTTPASTATPAATTAAAAIVVPTIHPTTAADRNAFVGKYQTVAGCVPSATCCCALNTVDITGHREAQQKATDDRAECL